MKHFAKSTMACAIAAFAATAAAEPVEVRDGSGALLVEYTADAVTVEGGIITLSNGIYVDGTVPGTGIGVEGLSCDLETTDLMGDKCVAKNGVGDAEDFCQGGTRYDEVQNACLLPLGDPPEITRFASSKSTLNPGDTATLFIDFSEPVTGFAAGDISASRGSLGTLQGSGDDYQIAYTANEAYTGNVTITIDGNSYEDNEGQSGAGQSLTLTVEEKETTDDGCEVPSGVIVDREKALTGFGTESGQVNFRIPQTGVLSAPVSTGNNPKFAGMFKMVGFSTAQGIKRKMWISDCPGGAPIKQCAQASGADMAFRWGQGYVGWGYCNLGTNGDYYLNVKHVSECSDSSGCKTITQNLTNDSQNL